MAAAVARFALMLLQWKLVTQLVDAILASQVSLLCRRGGQYQCTCRGEGARQGYFLL